MEQSYTSGRQDSGMERRQACRFRPLHLLLVIVCLSPVISTVPQVEARPNSVDLLLEDFTVLLQRAQRLEQAGVPVFQRLQQHLNAFVIEVEDAQRSLWESVARDDAHGLEAAVSRGAVVERKNGDLMTPLALASKEGRAEAVRAILRLGAAVDSTAGAADWTPLLWARAYRRKDCETLLLAAGAHQGEVPDVQNVLFEAVGRDDAEGIEAAVHLGADVEAKDGEQMTALGLAAKEGRERAVSTLLRLGAEVEAAAGERGWSPLFWAVANRQNQTETLLREAGAKVEDVQKVLFEAVGRNDAEEIEAAVRLGADPEAKDDEQMTALGLAAKEGRERAVSTLLRLGAEVEASAGERGWSPLLWAVMNRQNQTEALLRKAGAKVARWKAQDLLWMGVDEDDELKIEGAILLGADLEEKKGWWTPLTMASRYGKLETVRALVSLGAQLERRGGGEQGTALILASFRGHEAVVRLLLEAGASLKAEDRNGRTSLHYASIKGHLPTVKLLVEDGADVKHSDIGGSTALTLAERYGHFTVAAYLRSVGATT